MNNNRLRLVKYSGPEDFHYFSSLVYNESIMKMNMGRVFTKEEAEEYFNFFIENDKKYNFAGNYKVFIEDSNIYIGLATLRPNEELSGAEIEYMILPSYWGNGYGNKIVNYLLKLATKNENLKEITAITHVNNIRSKKILLKNGFESYKVYKVEENNNLVEIFKKNI